MRVSRSACDAWWFVQKRFSRERIAALLEDRTLREADAQANAAAANAKLTEMTTRLTDAETALLQITKDHILGLSPPATVQTSFSTLVCWSLCKERARVALAADPVEAGDRCSGFAVHPWRSDGGETAGPGSRSAAIYPSH